MERMAAGLQPQGAGEVLTARAPQCHEPFTLRGGTRRVLPCPQARQRQGGSALRVGVQSVEDASAAAAVAEGSINTTPMHAYHSQRFPRNTDGAYLSATNPRDSVSEHTAHDTDDTRHKKSCDITHQQGASCEHAHMYGPWYGQIHILRNVTAHCFRLLSPYVCSLACSPLGCCMHATQPASPAAAVTTPHITYQQQHRSPLSLSLRLRAQQTAPTTMLLGVHHCA